MRSEGVPKIVGAECRNTRTVQASVLGCLGESSLGDVPVVERRLREQLLQLLTREDARFALVAALRHLAGVESAKRVLVDVAASDGEREDAARGSHERPTAPGRQCLALRRKERRENVRRDLLNL